MGLWGRLMEDPHGHNVLFTNASGDYTRLTQILKKLCRSSSDPDATKLSEEAGNIFMLYKQRYENMKENLDEFKMNVLCKLEDQNIASSDTVRPQENEHGVRKDTDEWDVNPFLVYSVANKS